MSTVVVLTAPIGPINVGLNGAVTAIVPLLAQFDLMLTGSFGLGSLLADLSAQFNAALSLQVQLSVGDPFTQLKALLQAVIAIQASIQASLSLGLGISLSFSVQISASASITAALALRLGGLHLLIQAALAIKLPVVALLASFNLTAGPVVLVTVGFNSPSFWGPPPFGTTEAEFAALAAGPIGSPAINVGDQVWGVMMLTRVPAASVALRGIIAVP